MYKTCPFALVGRSWAIFINSQTSRHGMKRVDLKIYGR